MNRCILVFSLLVASISHADINMNRCIEAMSLSFRNIDTHTQVDNFDIDDTILRLDTQIVLMEKNSTHTKIISSNTFADIFHDIGKPSAPGQPPNPWENYEVQGHGPQGSFRHFFHDPERNFYREDVLIAAQPGTIAWQGGGFKAFEFATSDPVRARHVFKVTARGATPDDIHAGDEVLHGLGYIKNPPPAENNIPVMHLFPDAAWDAVPELKLAALSLQLDYVNNHTDMVGKRIWTFSDDMPENLLAIMKAVSAGKILGKWPKLQPYVFYYGDHPWSGPHALAVNDDGTWRDLTEAEKVILAPHL